MGKGFLVGVMKIFWNYPVMTAVQPCGYIRNHGTVQFKRVNFMTCKLYLNF